MITLGAIVTTALVILFLALVFGIAGIQWVSAKHKQGVERRRYLLRAGILGGLAVAVVLSLAWP